MDESERLRLEYEAALEVLRTLTEVRFKLLALAPTLAGTVVVLASAHTAGLELLAIGLLGATATAGVLVYELRNSQIRSTAAARARTFEERQFPGGALVVPPRSIGRIVLGHTLGVALVYAAALAGWGYLIAWGALRVAGAGHARSIGLALGAGAGLAAARWIVRFEADAQDAAAAAPQPT